MRLRLGVSAQGQKTYLTPQRLGRCCVPSEAGTYRGLRCAFVAAHCIAHFLLPDPQPHPIILITRVDTRATDIMVMTGKRSGLDSAVRAGCPNGGISDKARSLVRYLVGNGGDTMHNMDVRNYDHDLTYKFGMSEDVGYDSDLQAANVHRSYLTYTRIDRIFHFKWKHQRRIKATACLPSKWIFSKCLMSGFQAIELC